MCIILFSYCLFFVVVSGVGCRLAETMKGRIMILDGAMGTMIQQLKLEENDFRGEIRMYLMRRVRQLYVVVCTS